MKPNNPKRNGQINVKLILGIILAIIIVILIVQNTVSVPIKFLFWHFSLPLIIVIVVSLICGVLLTLIVQYFSERREKI